VTLEYRRPFVIAGGASATATNVFVELRTGDGAVGYGEAAPMPAYSGETAAGVEAAINDVLAPAVIGLDPREPGTLHSRMDAAAHGQPFAKAAIDFAAWDAAGRMLRVPVSMLLGGTRRPTVPLAWAVGLGSIDEMVEEAVRYAGAGFTIKLKVGRAPAQDLEVVREVRGALPTSTPIRVDANQGYDLPTARRVLPVMEEAAGGLQLIEQPLPAWDLDGAVDLARSVDAPLMADESLYSLHSALELVRRRACAIFNIKLLKPGGLYRARQVAAIAEAAGIGVVIGSMPEMGVGAAAGLHFAASLPNADYPHELIGPLMFRDDVLLGNPFGRLDAARGNLPVPTGAGFGVELDPRHLGLP
jgi:muconate cycloisomerase